MSTLDTYHVVSVAAGERALAPGTTTITFRNDSRYFTVNLPMADGMLLLTKLADRFADRNPITPAQRDVLVTIDKLKNRTGITPTQREIADEQGLSYAEVHRKVHVLLRKGVLSRTSPSWRTLTITPLGEAHLAANPAPGDSASDHAHGRPGRAARKRAPRRN